MLSFLFVRVLPCAVYAVMLKVTYGIIVDHMYLLRCHRDRDAYEFVPCTDLRDEAQHVLDKEARRVHGVSRSVVLSPGERVKVHECVTVSDVLSALGVLGIWGDYLAEGSQGERLDDARRLSGIDNELWLRVRGRGGARAAREGDDRAELCGRPRKRRFLAEQARMSARVQSQWAALRAANARRWAVLRAAARWLSMWRWVRKWPRRCRLWAAVGIYGALMAWKRRCVGTLVAQEQSGTRAASCARQLRKSPRLMERKAHADYLEDLIADLSADVPWGRLYDPAFGLALGMRPMDMLRLSATCRSARDGAAKRSVTVRLAVPYSRQFASLSRNNPRVASMLAHFRGPSCNIPAPFVPSAVRREIALVDFMRAMGQICAGRVALAGSFSLHSVMSSRGCMYVDVDWRPRDM